MDSQNWLNNQTKSKATINQNQQSIIPSAGGMHANCSQLNKQARVT
jgi:hypothetical protein